MLEYTVKAQEPSLSDGQPYYDLAGIDLMIGFKVCPPLSRRLHESKNHLTDVTIICRSTLHTSSHRTILIPTASTMHSLGRCQFSLRMQAEWSALEILADPGEYVQLTGMPRCDI